jgi:hypothetical protein
VPAERGLRGVALVLELVLDLVLGAAVRAVEMKGEIALPVGGARESRGSLL